MATRVTSRTDDPATTDVDEAQLPTADSFTSAVSGTVALPDDPFTQEQIDDLAARLSSRAGPFFLSNDVRSEESSKNVAKALLVSFFLMNLKNPEVLEPEPEPKTYPESSSSTGTSSTSTSSSSHA